MNDFEFLPNLSDVAPQRQWWELKPFDFILNETEISKMRNAYICIISKVAARFIPSLSFMAEVLPTQMKGVHSKYLSGTDQHLYAGLFYKNRSGGMIVHETAIHQMKVQFKLLQVPLWPSTMNQSPHHNRSCKSSEIQIVNLFIKHDNQPNLLKNFE